MNPENELLQSSHMYEYATEQFRNSRTADTTKAKKRAKFKLQRSALRFAVYWLEEWQKVIMHPPRKKAMQGGIDELKFAIENMKEL